MSLATEAIQGSIERERLLPRPVDEKAALYRVGYSAGLVAALEAVQRDEITDGMKGLDPIEPCHACEGFPPVVIFAGWPRELDCGRCGGSGLEP